MYMYRKQNLFQKILIGVAVFILMIIPAIVTKISIALNGEFKKEIQTVLLREKKTTAGTKIKERIDTIRLIIDEEISEIKGYGNQSVAEIRRCNCWKW